MTTAQEKVGFENVEAADSDHATTKQAAISADDFGFTEQDQKRIKRQVDRRLVLTVGAMYCVSLMDRTNLSAANIAGMSKDLVLIKDRYSIITLVFFITYVLFQPPSTIIVRKIGPRIHLASITALWGGVMIGMGFVKKWEEMAALRVILGVLEADEVGKRNSVFYIIGCVASAFAGILAFGLMQMAGLAGLNGWRWIFIIEGIITVLLGGVGYWLLVDFPDAKRTDWKFLNAREREWICARVEADRGDVKPQPFSLAKYLRAASDIKIWVYAMIFFNTTTVSYALAYFMPVILQLNMGFDVGEAQCLVAPPYAFAGLVMFATGWAGDKYRMRGSIIVFNSILCIIGLPIMGFHSNAAVRYFGIFLTTAGANANIPAAMSYQANNIRGQWKRAFCSATFVSFGGIGGIAGSLVFRSQDAPHYRPGMYACIATTLLNLILVGVMTLWLGRLNKQAERGERELECDADDTYEPGFRYTL
ncbi:hypothetical protein N0V88_005645 [Collariella sp. IMI 366227]|nr:hypothetical protein N0V88_005645 [Collariella sp. IMI 366227]